MKSTSKKSRTKRARIKARAPETDGLSNLLGSVEAALRDSHVTVVPPEPTIEEDALAEARRRAIVGKQRLPGRRKRKRKLSSVQEIDKAIRSHERKIATLKRAKALLAEQKTTRRGIGSARLALSLTAGKPL